MTAPAVTDIEVIAEGLSEPRGLAFGPGKKELYVAEAGEGGDGPSAAHPILRDACYGKTGVITRIDEKGVKSAVKNLGSIAGPVEGLGPHDVSIHGRQLAFTTGFAGPPELRAQFGREAERTLGYLMTSPLKGGHQSGNVSRVADLVAYEDDANPAGGPSTAIPSAFSRKESGPTLRMPAGTTSWPSAGPGVSRRSPCSLIDWFLLGAGWFPMNAVPTTVVRGPGGDLYVGQLTGFPFPIGGARVYRVEEGEAPEIYADGFTNIIDIAFGKDGSLYVLEIAHNSLLAAEPEGALIKVDPSGDREIIAEDLFFPGGVALGKDDEIYVTNCGVCFDDGEVLRINP